MTAFVRSLFAKRNPRNVPLDLFDEGTSFPYPDPTDDRSLTTEEHNRRWQANEAYRRSLPWISQRISEAKEQYRGIVREAVGSIGERLYAIQSKDLTNPQTTKQWHDLGNELSAAVRDTLAARMTVSIQGLDLFLPKKTINISLGSKTKFRQYPTAQFRQEHEDRAELLGRWIRARATFEAKRHSDFQFFHGEASERNAETAKQAIQDAQNAVTQTQGDIASDQWDNLYYDLSVVLDTLSRVAVKLGSPSLCEAIPGYLEQDLPALRAEVKKAERLAEKGEAPLSRKRSKAEPKQNPFVYSILR